ncbi:MAG: Uma2 family endonuclease [Gemmataceae bacterium]
MATDLLDDAAEAATEPPLPDLFEVVNGQIVEAPPMSFYAGEVADLLNAVLLTFLATTDIGRSRVERLFHIPLPEDQGRNRRPDLAFVSYERWAKDRPLALTGAALDVVPDLAVEVVSPTDLAEEVMGKVREYLRGGVRAVWVIFPQTQELYAYTGLAPQVYTAADEVPGDPVLPGFRVKLADLFPPTA